MLLVLCGKCFQLNGCAISPDGTLVATGGQDNYLCIINIATQKKVYTVHCDFWVRTLLLGLIVLTISLRFMVWHGRPMGSVLWL